ncbi:MAG: hypothetical protein K6E86_05880 [Bacteroidales bacterium]|nr:hypothetical protein [Bacteroidales bacterium]
MEENNNMTAERSLEIIMQQIESSRRTISANLAPSLISWGTLVFVFALLISYLWNHHGGSVWNVLWAVMWGCGYLVEWLINKRRPSVPNSIISKTIGQVWSTFGLFIGAMGILFGLALGGVLPSLLTVPDADVMGTLYINLTSIISLCFGIASTITGSILKNRIIQTCGFIAGQGGFFGAIQFPGAEQLYVMAAVALIGLIVPGLIIYSTNKR